MQVEYDCRIVFGFDNSEDVGRIVLVDIGTHEDVY